MPESINIESLDLKKPLDKMTAKELRELAINKIPQITGASGMSKDELLSQIKSLCGLTEEKADVSVYKEQIWSLKKQIRELRAQKSEMGGGQSKEKDKLRKRIKQLKRQTRKLAAS